MSQRQCFAWRGAASWRERMKGDVKETSTAPRTKNRGFAIYAGVSLLVAFILLIDPLFNAPNGLITSSLFTGRPSDHGEAVPCNFDYEGSWQIGVASGPSPLTLQIANQSVLSCASVANATAASYVAEPCLVVPVADGKVPSSRLYAFYQVKSLITSKGEIGVAHSLDNGVSWHHLGTALTEPFSLSSPWVAYDPASQQYIMIPDGHKSQHHTISLYSTSKDDFPFGWKHAAVRGSEAHFMDTSAVYHEGQWWIFTTTHGIWQWWTKGPAYQLHLYHADSLLGEWHEHPLSPVSSDLRYARGGGRPFVYQGHVHRWAQDDSDYFGQSLHLFRASRISNATYLEAFVQTVLPSGNGNWYSARTHHIDVQQVGPNGTWYGLVDGDTHKDGRHHFHMTEARFVRAKHMLLRLTVFQLFMVSLCYGMWQSSDCVFSWLAGRLPWLRQAKTKPFKDGSMTPCWRPVAAALSVVAPELQLAGLGIMALLLSGAVFLLLPQLMWCPRWAMNVQVQHTPPVLHQDPGSPFSHHVADDLVIVTGATASFFDRLSNMVGSVHVWEPTQRVIVYDLGFSQTQLAKMMCWRNVEVRRFPYEKYPDHVRDVRNYAFKTLVLQEALADSSAVLWIDSGLELRAPMTTMRTELAKHGHVSAMQEDLIGDAMYTFTRTMVDFYGLGAHWDEIKQWGFCAGGLQGFVRGSDAERLVLNPVVNCSLHEKECIAPPGSSRKNHNFDQTALTIQIWANNFSCLPRETHCMWSVKKVSRDPRALSLPIEVVSRGHRQPKPYADTILRNPGCVPDVAAVPWPALGFEQQESLTRYNLAFRVSRIWLQPVGDAAVQAYSCLGSHLLVQLLWGMSLLAMACGTMGCARLRSVWMARGWRMVLHLTLGPVCMLVGQGALFWLMVHVP
ncbi:hypothetical protein V8C86DRAFT_2612716 [Haematococcus lacustris]